LEDDFSTLRVFLLILIGITDDTHSEIVLIKLVARIIHLASALTANMEKSTEVCVTV
jgi:hypothetical protein